MTAMVAGCAPGNDRPAPPPEPPAALAPAAYKGAQALIIDDNLVNFLVTVEGAAVPEQVTAYAECIAAGYAQKRGDGFARHIRTNVQEEGGIWRADAVYTFSRALPQGLKTMDADVTVQNCAAEHIPTV